MRAKLVVVAAGDRDVGLAVEAVTGVVDVPAGGLEPLPAESELVTAVAQAADGRLVLVLDVDRACAEAPAAG